MVPWPRTDDFQLVMVFGRQEAVGLAEHIHGPGHIQ